MLDLDAFEVSAEEKELLDHPLVGGIILFARNYAEPSQLVALTKSIRQAARNNILIAVDHEGGRVQRFREGFSRIPAMGKIIEQQKMDPAIVANACGQIIAFELLQHNVDLTFAPVLDRSGISDVIGDRGFDHDPEMIVKLSKAFILGLRSMGMRNTGKHFPGHGGVKADSHVAMPVDDRSFTDITELDMKPFVQLIQQQLLDSIMPAHVIYSNVDDKSAGFSEVWIKDILRSSLGFKGVIFSDDLSMQAASSAGNVVDRTGAALTAGCDMALVCNDRKNAIAVLDNLPQEYYQTSSAHHLLPDPQVQYLNNKAQYIDAKTLIDSLFGAD